MNEQADEAIDDDVIGELRAELADLVELELEPAPSVAALLGSPSIPAIYEAAFAARVVDLARGRAWADAMRDQELLARAHGDAAELAALAALPCVPGKLAQRACFKCRAIPGMVHRPERPR